MANNLTTVDGDTTSSCEEDSRQTIVDHLMMEEILPRLPVKSLGRFKLVCKEWNATISSNEFAKLHLKFSYSNNHNRYFLFIHIAFGEDSASYNILPYRENATMSDDDVISDRLYSGDLVVGSCNGLVCFFDDQYDPYKDDRRNEDHYEYQNQAEFRNELIRCFMVWNPATNEEREIIGPKRVRESVARGFGYVPSLDDYFIVASFKFRLREFSYTPTACALYVFSLNAGKWERIFGKTKRARGDLSHEECIIKRMEGDAVMVGNTMYWGQSRHNNTVGYNVVTKELKEYPRLEWQSEYDHRKVELFRVKGCLSFFGSKETNNNVWDCWTLRNPSDWSSWQKTLSIDLTNILLVTFSETGKCLVQQSDDEFKLVDPYCKEALESTKINKNSPYYGGRGVFDHVESLISPFGTTMSDENKDKIGEDDDYGDDLESSDSDEDSDDSGGYYGGDLESSDSDEDSDDNGDYYGDDLENSDSDKDSDDSGDNYDDDY